MELWIRSQDKERIIKINQLDVMELDTDVDPRYNHFGIYANEYLVGEYKSNERALEVLDEIHQKLIYLETLEIVPDSYKILPKDTSNVYEMPKE